MKAKDLIEQLSRLDPEVDVKGLCDLCGRLHNIYEAFILWSGEAVVGLDEHPVKTKTDLIDG